MSCFLCFSENLIRERYFWKGWKVTRSTRKCDSNRDRQTTLSSSLCFPLENTGDVWSARMSELFGFQRRVGSRVKRIPFLCHYVIAAGGGGCNSLLYWRRKRKKIRNSLQLLPSSCETFQYILLFYEDFPCQLFSVELSFK